MSDASSRADQEVWLATIERGLSQAPENSALLFERAKTLAALGRDAASLAAYNAVLTIDPQHFGALNDLGLMQYRAGSVERALAHFRSAVAADPHNPVGHANVAHMLLRAGEHDAARTEYERALGLAPKMTEAHRGLAVVLRALGDPAAALIHEAAGYAESPISIMPFRGSKPAPSVLLLTSSTVAAMPLRRLIDQRTFQVTKLVLEMSEYLEEIPAHDVIINCVGDSDAAQQMLATAEELCAASTKPVINPPRRIAQGGRVENAARFGLLPGIRAAKMFCFTRAALTTGDVEARLSELNLATPFLIRGRGQHNTAYFMKITRFSDVPRIISETPCEAFYVMQYFDLRAENGAYRKFRMINIDGMLYPLHASTAQTWHVSSANAEMSTNPAYRAFEEAFLRDPASVIGSAAMRQLRDIAVCLELDYSGIDFGIDRDGNVVVFEASATMDVLPPADDEKWNYRWFAVQRIQEAVTRMLLARVTID